MHIIRLPCPNPQATGPHRDGNDYGDNGGYGEPTQRPHEARNC